MYVDSHCHINFPALLPELDNVLALMRTNQVTAALCVSVDMESFDAVNSIATQHAHIFASVGVHPNHHEGAEPDELELVRLASLPKVVAIGETGLDYFRQAGDAWPQQQRFRTHIRAAVKAGKPLIVHTRQAAADTLRIMKEENARDVGGVMHCFTEDWDTAQKAMDQGFFISLSGIVSFKNAVEVRVVAQKIPLSRLLIETDSPYLAPVPFRGKTNQPGYVKYVAEAIAELRGVSPEEIGQATTENFRSLFKVHASR